MDEREHKEVAQGVKLVRFDLHYLFRPLHHLQDEIIITFHQ